MPIKQDRPIDTSPSFYDPNELVYKYTIILYARLARRSSNLQRRIYSYHHCDTIIIYKEMRMRYRGLSSPLMLCRAVNIITIYMDRMILNTPGNPILYSKYIIAGRVNCVFISNPRINCLWCVYMNPGKPWSFWGLNGNSLSSAEAIAPSCIMYYTVCSC